MRDRTIRSWVPALAAAFLAPALHLVRYGYAFGFSDQDEFLPWLLHRLDGHLLSTDWFVGVQESSFNVRSGFMAVLDPLATAVGIEPAVLLLYSVSWLVLGLAVYDVMAGLSRSPGASLLGTVALLVLVPRWTVGGNALTSSMLVPSMVAWSLSVSALALSIRGRAVLPGLLLGAAAWMQPLVAFTAGSAILAGSLVRAGRPPGAVLRAGLLLVVPTALVVLPLGALLLLNRPAPVLAGSEPRFADILIHFRAPHHFLPGAFPVPDVVRTLVLAALGAGGLLVWRSAADAGRMRTVIGVLAATGLFAVAGFVGMAVPAAALLLPFKASVLAGLVFVALVVAGAATLARARAPRLLVGIDRLATSPATALVAAAVLVVAAMETNVVRSADPGLAAAADWLRAREDARETVAVPPSATGFRFRSGRGVIATFKAVPFGPADTQAWHRRLSDLAPGRTRPADMAVGPLLEALDAAFERLGSAELDEIARRYGASWVVRRTPIVTDSGPWTMETSMGSVFVYRLNPEGSP